ncbi:MAG: ATP-dependent DNA helicase chl1 [Thelocarpon superellum]|nr:MAG: ATP-dependent DNA helicase chl1 [Thelocarpon superellum]
MASSDAGRGRDFHHPFTPYDIQVQFMNAVYDCLQEGHIGIFESPTGTFTRVGGLAVWQLTYLQARYGKSLSLICGSLTWLRDHKRKALDDELNVEDADADEPAWMVEHAREEQRQRLLRHRHDLEARLVKIREREQREKERYAKGIPVQKKTRLDDGPRVSTAPEDDDLVLDDYESDDASNAKAVAPGTEGLSVETQALMKRFAPNPGDAHSEEDGEKEEMKIFYCSRTYSQLDQFVNELRRIRWISSPDRPGPAERDPPASDTAAETLKHLALGSRSKLCINDKVTKGASDATINERCLDLQRPATPKDRRCPYLPTKENQTLVHDFRDYALARVRDIEEFGVLGRKLGICAYYASRATVPPSEIITLTYPMLLHKSMRESLKLSMKGHVVVIDEAHNLIDTITGLHSVRISYHELQRLEASVRMYWQRYASRTKGKNRVYMSQVQRLLRSLREYLEQQKGTLPREGVVVTLGDLVTRHAIDQINLHKLLHYLHQSRLARKVEGLMERLLQPTTEPDSSLDLTAFRNAAGDLDATKKPGFSSLEGFLLALTHPAEEGQLFCERTEDDDVCLKYTLLDATHHFQDIVTDARAVILAGGTMSPMDDYLEHLLDYVPRERIQTLSCGHVIPAENLLAWAVSHGPSGVRFEFNFEMRNSVAVMDELGRTLVNLCRTVPDGVVVFFPSYNYLDQVVRHWRSTTVGAPSLWERLGQRKAVFCESKAVRGVDTVLQEYSGAVDGGKGGLLLAVVGGKLSEGINFSDALGRCVVMVGLPFPNIRSAEWKAKLAYIEHSTHDRLGQHHEGEGPTLSDNARQAKAKTAARDFYDNACMRAVNQSIGRAIRHRNDYATIILLDQRYGSERIRTKLPRWIQAGLVTDAGKKSFGEVMGTAVMSPLDTVAWHHHRTNVDKYHPGYFGKVGMRYFHKLQNHFWKPVVNLDKLWSLVPAEHRAKYLESAEKGKESSTAPVLDLLPLGYSKVLGKGRIPEIPIVVRARYVSKLAEKKIKEAGGIVELVA